MATTESWTARKMVPSVDTISVMALHYGLKPSQVRDVIRTAGVKVIRDDGFKGTLVTVSRSVGWSDGKIGVDPKTTKLTAAAIKAVSSWKFAQDDKNADDN